jgi:hypothetical protein
MSLAVYVRHTGCLARECPMYTSRHLQRSRKAEGRFLFASAYFEYHPPGLLWRRAETKRRCSQTNGLVSHVGQCC